MNPIAADPATTFEVGDRTASHGRPRGVWSRPFILLNLAVLFCYTSQYLLMSTLPLFAPVVALWLVAPPNSNYLAVFLLAGLSGLIGTAVVRWLARTSPGLARVDEGAAKLKLNLTSIVDRRVLLATFLLFTMTLTYPATTSFIPVYARELGIENSGAYFGVSGLVTIVASRLMGRLFNRGSRAMWLIAGFGLCILGVFGLILATDLLSLTLAG